MMNFRNRSHQLSESVTFPFDIVSETEYLIDILEIKIEVKDRAIEIIVIIPIIFKQQYQLIGMNSFPLMIQNTWLSILPERYSITDIDTTEYNPLSEIEFQECKSIDNYNQICSPTLSWRRFATRYTCELALMRNQNVNEITERCKFQISNFKYNKK